MALAAARPVTGYAERVARERHRATAEVLDAVPPRERHLARLVLLRNYARPGSTLAGCVAYTRAVFAVPLRPRWAP